MNFPHIPAFYLLLAEKYYLCIKFDGKMKVKIALILMFSANMLMLAHNIIPHHHHHGIPHFYAPNSGNHDEKDDCCEQTCLFEQDLDAIVKDSSDDCHCCCSLCALHHHHDLFLSDAIDFFGARLYRPAGFLLVEQPCLINYLCDYSASGAGLRAPPSEL
jgi:hypothetical protein